MKEDKDGKITIKHFEDIINIYSNKAKDRIKQEESDADKLCKVLVQYYPNKIKFDSGESPIQTAARILEELYWDKFK